ncbi:MAG: hypothetical protein CMK59_11660 [Proteobacteria bacterium]|nr:hypothetical protein [Pseudomonadota bacterium]
MIFLSIILGCETSKDISTDHSSADTQSEIEEDTESEQQETEEGTDADGDGFTVENGDCDDTTPWINPLMDEELGDQVDNDCDGRIDEQWTGVDIARVNQEGRSHIITMNILGQIEREIRLDEECLPIYIDHQKEDGWVISNGYVSVTEVTSQGECTVLADFSEDEEYPNVFGILTHPEGYYLASQGNRLISIDEQGNVDVLTSWSSDPMDEEFNLDGRTIAIDLVTWEVAIFGWYGGFATWSEEQGFIQHRKANVEEFDGLFAYSGTAKDGGGWFSLVYDSNTGSVSVRRFNFDQNEWIERMSWSEETGGAQEYAIPGGITINGDFGEYYVTANIASYHSVWRMREADNLVDDLYRSPSSPGVQFLGIVSNY